jgi:protein gp37
MADLTLISWTDRTHNEWIGCTKLSAGCTNCYAEVDTPTRVLRAHGQETWGPRGIRHLTSASNRRKPYAWNKQDWQECDCGWRGPMSNTHIDCPECGRIVLHPTRQRVFCSSLSDVFEVNPQLKTYRRDLFKTIEDCRNLDWLLLTKRPEYVVPLIEGATGRTAAAWLADCRHVRIGTTVENQPMANQRIPALLKIPSSLLFLSCEPLLGPIDFTVTVDPGDEYGDGVTHWNMLSGERWMKDGFEKDLPGERAIDWVIAGGESGQNARPMHPAWARSLRDQCELANIPFHFKQWGEWLVSSHLMVGEHPDTGQYARPWRGEGDDTLMVRVGKKAAGHVLDGRMHRAFPDFGKALV